MRTGRQQRGRCCPLMAPVWGLRSETPSHNLRSACSRWIALPLKPRRTSFFVIVDHHSELAAIGAAVRRECGLSRSCCDPPRVPHCTMAGKKGKNPVHLLTPMVAVGTLILTRPSGPYCDRAHPSRLSRFPPFNLVDGTGCQDISLDTG